MNFFDLYCFFSESVWFVEFTDSATNSLYSGQGNTLSEALDDLVEIFHVCGIKLAGEEE